MEREATLIRYRFDTFDQLGRHVHLVDGAGLIFLPDKPGESASGRVLLELAVRERAQQTAVRGEVVVRTARGVWLQLADSRLAVRLLHGGFDGRREGRLSADAVLSLEGSAGTRLLARLVDIGIGGMRVRGMGRLLEGETYAARLINAPRSAPSDLGKAQVVRFEGSEAGMRFVAPRSPMVERYLRLLLDAWIRAPEIAHAAGCCAGELLEPPPPRLRRAAGAL
jgi:hypothetical protein